MDNMGYTSNTSSAFPVSARTPQPVPFESIGQLIQAAVASLEGDPNRARLTLLRVSDLLRDHRDENLPAVSKPSREVIRGGLATWQLKKVLRHIESRLEYTITGQELADLIGVSRGQLFRGFKASVGMQPLHYVAEMRVRLAKKMMCTTRNSLAHIALACGLCDQSHFCRTFRRIVGQSPNKWRREHALEPV
jgi:AraC family transcriptional regulator